MYKFIALDNSGSVSKELLYNKSQSIQLTSFEQEFS